MTPLFVRLFVLVAIFVSVFLLSQLILNSAWQRRSEKRAINWRLKLLRSGVDRDQVAVTLLKNAPPVLSPNAGLIERLHVRLIRMVMMSAIRMETSKLLYGMTLAFVALSGIILLFAWSARFQLTLGMIQLVLVIAAAIAFGLPLIVISRMAQRRRKRMEEQFPVALDIFTRSLRAGHPIASAIHLITEEMKDPIGSEFGLVSDEVSYGADLQNALLAMAQRWDLEDMRMFVVSVSVQSETGGNLAEILENLSTVIRARASMYMKVRALSSEGRMTGWMLTVLPILTLISMFMVSPAFYFDVAQDPIFVIGFPSLLVLYCIGVFAIRRITDLKV